MASQWLPPATPPPEDLHSIPIQLPLVPSATTTHTSESEHTISANSTVEHLANKIDITQTWSHLSQQASQAPEPEPAATVGTPTIKATALLADHTRNQKSSALNESPRSPGTAPTYPRALGPDTSAQDRSRPGTSVDNSSRYHQQQQHQQQRQQYTGGSSSSGGQQTDGHPTGTPRVIVRIDRDHNIGDEGTRFECEQFPEEFLGRVTRAEFKGSVEGINRCMEVAEESLWNCFDTLLDCLSAYTAKHCCGTHYQRSIRKMEAFIQEENRRVYHPARMHLRDPQKVGMIYLEFELY